MAWVLGIILSLVTLLGFISLVIFGDDDDFYGEDHLGFRDPMDDGDLW